MKVPEQAYSSQLTPKVGHREPNTAQIYMSEGQINPIALYVSMYFKVDKGPTKRHSFGPQAAC